MDEPNSKKRKTATSAASETDTSKPTAVFVPSLASRPYTITIAVPCPILSHAQSHELRTHLIGTIARAAAVFCVDEIVIFSDEGPPTSKSTQATEMLVHVLSYLEAPQYLRRHLFPLHPNLKSIGLLPPLDIPSHFRSEEGTIFREGIAENREGNGTVVEAGLKKKVFVDAVVPEGTRLTLRFANEEEGAGRGDNTGQYVKAEAVRADTPRLEAGMYWGYTVRSAESLSAVFTESPFDGGYDVTIGTSERGEDIKEVQGKVPVFKHMLVAFGGPAGLEQALEVDEVLKDAVGEVRELFDFWVNVCPGQGSRAIRTEEAVWIALSRLNETVGGKGAKAN